MRVSTSLRTHRACCMREVTSSATSRVQTLRLTVNMADPVEARFDAAVNVVRSMPKKGINQSFHNKNLSTKERLFVFRLVVFS